MNNGIFDGLQRIKEMGGSEMARDRLQLYAFAKALALSEDGPKLIDSVIELIRGKVYYRICMHFAYIYFHSRRDFPGLAEFFHGFAKNYNDDPFVAYSYATALFSIAQLEAAKQVLVDSISNKVSSADFLRAATLLSDMGFYWESASLREYVRPDIFLQRNSAYDILQRRNSMSCEFSKATSARLPVFCISLKTDVRKRTLAEALYRRFGIDLTIVSALEGKSLPAFACTSLTANSKLEKELGTIGCFLSHVKSWECLANSNFSRALIVEDDGLPFMALHDNLDLVATRRESLIFVNRRMSSLGTPDIRFSGHVSTCTRLRELPDTQRGWGADGYILSKIGAEQLLEFVALDKICGHLDGQLGTYGCGEIQENGNRATGISAVVRSGLKSSGALQSSCENFPMIHEVNFGMSSR